MTTPWDKLGRSGQLNVLENVIEKSSTLAAYFGVDARTIRRDLSVLQGKGIIRHEGPDKGGRWVILSDSHSADEGS